MAIMMSEMRASGRFFKNKRNCFMSLPFLAVAYARINNREKNVAYDHAGEHKRAYEHAVCKHKIYIFLQNSFIHQPSDSRIRKDDFEHKAAAEQACKQIRAARNVRVERVAECVVKIHSLFAHTPRAQRHDVRKSHLVEHRCAYHAHCSAHAA